MLLLDVSRIRTPVEHYEWEYRPDAFGSDRDAFTVATPARLTFDLHKADNDRRDEGRFRLVGRVATTLELGCSRCLEPFAWPIDAAFDLQYLPRDQNVGDDEREIDEDDLAIAYYDAGAIDLGQLMREQFLLSIPMKPLCRDDCRGLCAQCGASLNGAPCGCRQAWDDPRLAALRTIKERYDA